MSVKITSQVWERSQQSGSHLLVMLAIADYAHDDGLVWVRGITLPQLAKKARLSERQAQRVIATLSDDGEIYAPIVQGRGHTTRYFITIGFDAEHIAAVLVREYHLPTAEAKRTAADILARQEKVTSVTPFSVKGDIHDGEKVTSRARKGDIQGKRKPASKASQPAKSDPIRNDPYIDPEEEGTAPVDPALTAAATTVCNLPKTISPKVKDQLDSLLVLLTGERVSPEVVLAFSAFWQSDRNWIARKAAKEGRKVGPPTPQQVIDLWPDYTATRPAPKPTHEPRRAPALEPERKVLTADEQREMLRRYRNGKTA